MWDWSQTHSVGPPLQHEPLALVPPCTSNPHSPSACLRGGGGDGCVVGAVALDAVGGERLEHPAEINRADLGQDTLGRSGNPQVRERECGLIPFLSLKPFIPPLPPHITGGAPWWGTASGLMRKFQTDPAVLWLKERPAEGFVMESALGETNQVLSSSWSWSSC
jgi:hypothetical protein